jgi:hypothetical protein
LVHKPGEKEAFTSVYALDAFDSMIVDIRPSFHGEPSEHQESKKIPGIKVTAMPGKYVPPGILGHLNDLIKTVSSPTSISEEVLTIQVPPTNGYMLELRYTPPSGNDDDLDCGYRIYISEDTLMVDELKEIPERYKGRNIDLMLAHLGGTTIPSPKMPLLMITMNATQGLQLV